MKKISKKWIFAFSIILIILISIIVGYYSFVYDTTCDETSPGSGPGKGMGGYWTQNYTLLALLVIVIVIIVLISYYLLSKKVDKHLNDNMKLISQIVNNSSHNNQPEIKETKNYCKTVLLKFLNYKTKY